MFENIRKQLEEREQQIVTRIQNIDADKTKEDGPLNADSEEQVVELENIEVLDGLDEMSREELADIRAALDKIADGSYGTCTDCNESIPIKRLEALPNAIRCIQCEEKSEQAG